MAKNILTASALKKSRECREQFVKLSGMHLTGEEDTELERRNIMKAKLIECVSMKSIDVALKEWNVYFDDVFETLPGAESMEAGNIPRFKGARFIRWFFEKGYKVDGRKMAYAFKYDKDILVKDKIDLMVSTPDGERPLLMNISWKINPYSSKARRADNSVINSVELLCMQAGNALIKADACICYLTSKDDKSKALVDEFEKKPEKNVAYLEFAADAKTRLCEAMSFAQDRDCDSCVYRKECNASSYIPCLRNKVKGAEETAKTEKALTSPQQKVVDFVAGKLCVVAVPGAGKTMALVERTKKLVESGVAPDKICMCTFTKKAAAEYSGRVTKVCRKGVMPDAFTLHSLAHYIMSEIAESDRPRKVATELARLKLIKEAVGLSPVAIKGVSYDFPNGEFGLYRTLNKLFKNIALDGGSALRDHPDPDGVMEVYKIFSRLYKDGNYFEYDDLITECVAMLENSVEIRKKVHDRWQYLMVDEVQDIDEAQWKMVGLIQHGNLVVVGDDDQEIYSWRGGSSRFMLSFKNYYPDGKILYMEDNFRCTKPITDVADKIANVIGNRYNKTIIPSNTDMSVPVYKVPPCDHRELARLVKKQIEGGIKPEDICILGRKNADLEKLCGVLAKEGVNSLPPRLFMVESQIFDLIYCLLMLYREGPATPETCLYRLRKYMGKDCEKNTDDGLFSKYFREEPESVTEAIDSLTDCEDIEDGIIGAYRAITGVSRVSDDVFQFCKKVKEEEISSAEELYGLMHEMVYYKDEDEMELPKMEGYVNVLTLHKAKGKEWPVVFLYGIEDLEDTDESFRLGYVGVTRAQKACVIVRHGLAEAPVLDVVSDMLTELKEGELLYA